MINFPTLPAAGPEHPENPAKIGGSGVSSGDFATLLVGETAVGAPEGGKTLPDSGKAMPVEGDATAQVQATVVQSARKADAAEVADPTTASPGAPRPGNAQDRSEDTSPAGGTEPVAIASTTSPALVRDAIQPVISLGALDPGTNPAVQTAVIAPESGDAPAAEGLARSGGKAATKEKSKSDKGEAVIDEAGSHEVVAQVPALLSAALPETASSEPAEGQAASQGAPAVPKHAISTGVAKGTHAVQTDLAAPKLFDAVNIAGGKDAQGTRQDKASDQPQAGKAAKPLAPLVSQELKFELTKDSKSGEVRDLARLPVGQAQSSIQSLAPAAVQADVSNGPGPTHNGKIAFGEPNLQQPVRPHDFNMLVDRLVEARESARTGSVALAVVHADFGEVSLRFSHENGNLSVSMANHDPDFVRAVNAAVQADGSQAGQAFVQSDRRDGGMQQFSQHADAGAQASAGRGGGYMQRGEDQHQGDHVQPERQGRSNGLGGIYA